MMFNQPSTSASSIDPVSLIWPAMSAIDAQLSSTDYIKSDTMNTDITTLQASTTQPPSSDAPNPSPVPQNSRSGQLPTTATISPTTPPLSAPAPAVLPAVSYSLGSYNQNAGMLYSSASAATGALFGSPFSPVLSPRSQKRLKKKPASPSSSPSAGQGAGSATRLTAAEEEIVRRIHAIVGGAAQLSVHDEPAVVRNIVIDALANCAPRPAADAERIRRGQLSASERRIVRTVTNRGAAVRSRMRQRRELAVLKMQVKAREGRVRQLEAVVRALCAAYSVPLPPSMTAAATEDEGEETEGMPQQNYTTPRHPGPMGNGMNAATTTASHLSDSSVENDDVQLQRPESRQAQHCHNNATQRTADAAVPPDTSLGVADSTAVNGCAQQLSQQDNGCASGLELGAYGHGSAGVVLGCDGYAQSPLAWS